MADEDPQLDLPEVDDEEKGFPWIGVLVIVVVIAAAAFWIIRGKSYQMGHATSVTALEQQLTKDKATLDAERQKVFDMTNQLEALKQAMKFGKVPDHAQAVAEYNKLAADQVAEREKVKNLADQYNEKVAKLHQLQ